MFPTPDMGKQGDIKALFAKGRPPSAASVRPLAEGPRLPELDSQTYKLAENFFDQYKRHKRLRALATDAPTPLPSQPSQRSAKRRRVDAADAESDRLLSLGSQQETTDKADGDTSGFDVLQQARQLIRPEIAFSREQYKHLIAIMRAHHLHQAPDLSLQAYSLLQQLMKLHPPCKVVNSEDGKPCLVHNSQAFDLAERTRSSAMGLYMSAFNVENLIDLPLPFEVLLHWAECAHMAVISPSQPQHYGELLAWKWAVQTLEQDGRARVQVFNAWGKADKPGLRITLDSLLTSCQLWRIISSDMAVPWTGIASVETLVQTLARTIASAAAANVHPCIGQLSSIDIGSIAARLLNALLLVLGTAEEAGMLFKGNNRRRSIAGNERIALDKALLHCFTHDLASAKKQCTLLAALAPTDCMRLIGLLVAQRRVLRAEDKDTYPSLCTASRLLNNPGSAERPLYVQPLEVLQYLSTELFTSNFSSKTVGPFGLEGIVRIVAQLVHAATAVVQGDAEVLQQLHEAVNTLVDQLFKQAEDEKRRGQDGFQWMLQLCCCKIQASKALAAAEVKV